uniref:Uncharacterized protein n=1 Tax=Toxoplasma gondii (strain ATCC 50861 / VEG) TaxID=432359 RepID=A0A0F7V0R2_TOXGV|nr:TPA: hypothetical protein BN1205_084890 [Toxoplasma gondii VEG]
MALLNMALLRSTKKQRYLEHSEYSHKQSLSSFVQNDGRQVCDMDSNRLDTAFSVYRRPGRKSPRVCTPGASDGNTAPLLSQSCRLSCENFSSTWLPGCKLMS